MSELTEELQIDCGASTPNRRPRKPAPKPTTPPATGKQAPVGLKQKPVPPLDQWDRTDGRSVEFGTAEELRAQLIARLEEALARAHGEWQENGWDCRSPTWPWTKIGMLLLRCVSLADAVAERISKEINK